MAGVDKDDVSPAVARAQQLLKEKRYADALQVCNDELARGADEAELRLVAAQSLLAQGRQEGAKKEAQQAVRMDPTLAEAHRVLAEVACTRGELAIARDHLNRVLELDPEDEKSRALLESLSRPVGAAGAKVQQPTPSPKPAAFSPRLFQDDVPTASTPPPEIEAPISSEDSIAVELSSDDLEEEVEEDEEESEPTRAVETSSAEELERFVDPFSGESFKLGSAGSFGSTDVPVSDSMIVEVPAQVESGEPARGLKTLPEIQPLPKLEPLPPPAAVPALAPALFPPSDPNLFDAGPTTVSLVPEALVNETRPPPVEQAWKPPMDAGAGAVRKYEGTLRLPALDELPEEEDAPTMPLLRPSGPPKPQLRLDPLAPTPIEERPQGQGRRPSAEAAPVAQQFTARLDRPRPGRLIGDENDSAFEEFIEPPSVPLSRPDPKPIRESLDPVKARQDLGTGRSGAALPEEPGFHSQDATPSGDLLSMLAGRADPSMSSVPAQPAARQHRPTGPVPPDLARPKRPSAAMSPASDSGRRKAKAADSGRRAPIGTEEPTGDGPDGLLGDLMQSSPGRNLSAEDIERQIAAATSGAPGPILDTGERSLPKSRKRKKERSGGARWVIVAIIGLAIGGGGLAGYLYYDHWQYMKKEWAGLREAVHRSTPDGYREAHEAAERILKRSKNDPKALAALAMCDAAMSIEFGDDRLKSARERLELSKGTDSEWRTAANAFLALMDEPARAEGYLLKGLEVYPESALLRYLRGRALASSETPEKAGEEFKSALKLAPKYVAARIALAVLEGQTEAGYPESIRALDQIVEGDKDCLQALIDRARLRARHGKDLDEAAIDARRVTGDLAAKAGRGQIGWGHLVLAQVAALGQAKNKWATVTGELDSAIQSPPCCDSAFRYELAGELMKVHRMSDAQAQIKEALALKPKQAEYVQRLARVLIELDDPAAALGQLQNAPPRHPETRLLSGRAFFAQGSYVKAAEALKSVLAENKDNLEAAIYLELTRARRGSAGEAMSALDKLAEANATSSEPLKALGRVALWSGDLAKAEAALKAAWKLEKADPAVPTLLGQVSMRRHSIERAQTRFNKALEIRRDYRQARIGLAMLMMGMGKVTDARSQIGLIAEAERQKADVRALEARLALAEGKLDAAKSSLAEAESAGLAPLELARLTGEVALARKDGKTAEEALRKASKGVSKDGDLLMLLGRAQLLINKVDDAYDTFHVALKEDPGNPLALLELGRIAVKDGEHGNAVKRLTDALAKMKERFFPSSEVATVHAALGAAYLKQKDTGKAMANLQDAIDLDPNAAEPQFLMGQTYDKVNSPQRAVQFYAKAIQLDPSRGEVYELLGHAYAKMNDAPNAVKYFNEFLRTNPPAAKAKAVQKELQKLQ